MPPARFPPPHSSRMPAPTPVPSRAPPKPPRSPTSATTSARAPPTRTCSSPTSWSEQWVPSLPPAPSPLSKVCHHHAPRIPSLLVVRDIRSPSAGCSRHRQMRNIPCSLSANVAFTPEFLKNMSASADVLAMAKVEVDLNAIPEGKNVIIKWRGKPVFIRHRTAEEIDEANKVNVASLRDPQTDEDRVQKPEWLVMLGMKYFDLFRAQLCLVEHAANPTKRLEHGLLTLSSRHRCLHTSWLCTDWRGRRLRRLVLPLPRLSLRYLRTYKERTCSPEPRDPFVRVPRGGQASYWLKRAVQTLDWRGHASPSSFKWDRHGELGAFATLSRIFLGICQSVQNRLCQVEQRSLHLILKAINVPWIPYLETIGAIKTS